MSELPKGWEKTKLYDFAHLIMGQSPISDTYNTSKNGLPFFQGKAEFGSIYPTTVKYCSQPLKIAQPEDVLISVRAPVGPTNLCKEVSCIGRGLAAIRPLGEVSSRYLLYYLRNIEEWLSSQGTGSTFTAVSKSDLEQLDIIVAPLSEQRRIVAKLEKLLGKVEACQKRLEKIPLILKRFRQSVLAAACSGRLTADWRELQEENESVQETLKSLREKRLYQAKTTSEKDRITAIYNYAEENYSDELPGEWSFVALNKLCSSFDYGTSTKSQSEGLVPVLRMGNIQNGKIDWSNLVYTSDRSEIEKYKLKPRTVLFNRTNSPELVGKTAIYCGERDAIFAGYLIRVNNFDCLDSHYLNYCLNTTYAKEFCLRVKTDGVSQSNINAQKLGTFEIPFCSLAEQQEIVRRVESLFKIADQIEARYRKAKAHVDKLTQSILSKAFRGELVPQDPADEPASVLLERIRREREQTPAVKKKAHRVSRHKKQTGLFSDTV